MSESSHLKQAGAVGLLEHFTIRDGLPDMKIESVFEDSRGTMWFGTHDRGVVCYEGDEFRSYSRRDGLAGDGVYSICEDDEGTVFLGTNQGVTRYDGRSFEVMQTDAAYRFLWGSCVDREGFLWFGLERVSGQPAAACRWDGVTLEPIYLSDETSDQGQSVHQIVQDDRGLLWFGGDGLHCLDDGEANDCSFVSRQVGTVFNLLVRGNGDLWICSENGLFSWDHRELLDLTPGVELGFVAIGEGPSGNVLLTTYDGQLVEWESGEFTCLLQTDATFWRGLHLDRVGRLWMGTYGTGLYCYDTIRVQVFEKIGGRKSGPVLSLAEDGRGDLWLATRNGVAGFDGQMVRALPGTELLGDSEVSSLLIDSRGRSWIGTMAGQLFVLESDRQLLIYSVSDTEGVTIANLREDLSGRIWFGFRHGTGFGCWDEDHGVKIFRSDSTAAFPSKIGALEVGSGGAVWLGSGSPGEWDGLCKFDGETFEAVDGISGCSILALCEDDDGTLWVGTSEGLYVVMVD